MLPLITNDDFGNPKESFPNDLKITASDGELSRQLILSMGGVGEYRFRLNDTRRPWTQQTIAFSELDIIDPSLWELHPPNVAAERLDLDAKRNQSYIKFGRSRGYLPHEGVIEKEKVDMANAQVVETVMQDVRTERARADQLLKDDLERTRRELQEAKEAAKVVPAEPKPPQSDLLNVVTSVAALAKSLQPAKDDSLAEYLKLQQERERTERERDKDDRKAIREEAAAERKRADDLQAEILRDLKAAATAQQAVVSAPPPSEIEILEREVKKKGLLKQLYGSAHAEEETPAKPGIFEKYAEILPHIAGPLSQLIQGIFQTVQIVSYNSAVAKNGTPPLTPTSMTKPPEPGQPIPPQAPQPTPEQIAAQQRLVIMIRALEEAAEPIMTALDDGDSGFEFAEVVIKFKRRPAYDMMRALGEKAPGVYDFETFKSNLGQLLNHPHRGPKTAQLWEKVAPLPTFGQFLEDFFNYDEIAAQAQESEAATA